MVTHAHSMPDRQAMIARLGRSGMKWLHAETALLRHDARVSLLYLSMALGLLLCCLMLVLSGLLLASQAAVIELEPVTGSIVSAMFLVAMAETGLAAVLAVTAIALLRRAALLPGLGRRLAIFRDMVSEDTQ